MISFYDRRQHTTFYSRGRHGRAINHWMNEDEWERYYDDELLTVKNIHYNYNFHDAEEPNCNSGGNARYIVEEDEDGGVIYFG